MMWQGYNPRVSQGNQYLVGHAALNMLASKGPNDQGLDKPNTSGLRLG